MAQADPASSPDTSASPERCAPGYAFDPSQRECVACNQPCSTGKPGVCGRGIVDCSKEVPVCAAAIAPGERTEACNGEDDNCDGRVDEGYDKDADGYTTCSGDCDDRNASVHPDAVERCNNTDNNCNGLIDDGFNVGGICISGEGVCAREGRRRCRADGRGVDCDAQAGVPSREICDGLDNDCNGRVDDGLGEVHCGVGACRRTIASCREGAQKICTPGEPGVELCGDAIDNDCDGQTDEGFPKRGRTCHDGVGACRNAGVYICSENRLDLVCNAHPSQPRVEICGNGVDDDCDGEVDKDAPGLGEPCNNGLLGQCLREGKRVCHAREGTLSCSAPKVRPQPERCDGLDNDCDGVIDNDVNETATCGQGACGGGTRTRTCVHGVWGEWSTCSTAGKVATEICGNRIDDDCDGVIDRDVEGLGDACENGMVGICARKGRLICDATTSRLVCSAGPRDPGQEICNGLDDDCDGTVDEGVQNACGGCQTLAVTPGQACDVPGGDECAKGVWMCDEAHAGALICTAKPALTDGRACTSDGNECTADLCREGSCTHAAVADGIACEDDDPCTAGDSCHTGICAGSSQVACDDGNVCTVDSCSAARGCFHTAIDGGVANICGGCKVLDHAPGEACTVAEAKGVCAAGSFRCTPEGTLACVQTVFAGQEICNGVDDNCDGEIDEGLGETRCGIGSCTVTIANCIEGKASTCVPRDPLAETCANMDIDDDCNGVVDDVAGLEQECAVAFGTCIIPGQKRCLGDAEQPVCVPLESQHAEDNDGNGIVNYCDHGETLAGGVEGQVGETLAGDLQRHTTGAHFDTRRTRAAILPWHRSFDAAMIAPHSLDQAMLLVSGERGNEGGIAALRAKDVAASGPIAFRSCVVESSRAPRHLFVVGDIADVVASTPTGYARYPKIASQIPSPLAGNYACRLRAETLLGDAQRPWPARRGQAQCRVQEIAGLARLHDVPLTFAGAVICAIEREGQLPSGRKGLGIDLITQRADGSFAHQFLPLIKDAVHLSEVQLMPLRDAGAEGYFFFARADDAPIAGVCHREQEWTCWHQSLASFPAPIVGATAVADAAGMEDLFLISRNGAAFRVLLDLPKQELTLAQAGGVSVNDGGQVHAAVAVDPQASDMPALVLGRDDQLSFARPIALGDSSPVIRPMAIGALMPESSSDDIRSGEGVEFRQPHAMIALPFKAFGGSDLFSAFEIQNGSQRLGEMGFFYWNANEPPSGTLSDIRFDGRHGRARIDFTDPSGDRLRYRAHIRAHHGGALDDWIDGIQGGELRFTVRGEAGTVGVWPITITVEVADAGGLSATSRAVVRRDGTLEAVSDY